MGKHEIPLDEDRCDVREAATVRGVRPRCRNVAGVRYMANGCDVKLCEAHYGYVCEETYRRTFDSPAGPREWIPTVVEVLRELTLRSAGPVADEADEAGETT